MAVIYKIHTMNNQPKPFYLVPANEPFLKKYDPLFLRFAEPEMHTLNLDVFTKLVEAGDVAGMQQIIIALQHQPHLIEKMIFALNLKFTEIEDSKLYVPAEIWKVDPLYLQWFRRLADSPVMMFFLHDEDARFYTLAGDILAENQLETKEGDLNGTQMVALEGEHLEMVMERLFNSCWWMLIYCHGSGFNPEPYIQGLLADLDLPLTFDEVYEAYQKDIEKGLSFRTVAQE